MSEPSKPLRRRSGSERHLLLRLWSDYVRSHWKALALATLLMTLEGSVLGVVSYLVGPMFDEVFVAKNRESMYWLGGVILALFTMRAFAGFGQRYLLMRTGLSVTNSIQESLVGHLLSLDDGFFHANAPGVLIERVRGDAQALQGTASSALTAFGRDLMSLLSLAAVVLLIDWRWALIALIGVPLIALPMLGLQKWIRRASRDSRQASATVTERLDEVFHGMHAIKINTLEAHERERFGAKIATFFAAQLRATIGQASLPALVDIVAALGFAGVLFFAGGQIVDGEKSLGAFMSFFTAMALVFDPLRRLSGLSGQLQTAMASLERLYGLFDERPAILDNGTLRLPNDALADSVQFEQVAFAYGEEPVLRGLSFTADAGKTTALVGPSGAGKSTVFSLIARLAEPQSGQITIGETPLEALPLASLRGQLSIVTQDAALFNETIRENIRRGRLEATDAEVEEAAEAAFVSEFTRTLDDGLDTVVGPRGSNLSGGQRQRVVIARAFLRDAPILLLDEPTSALDASSEQAIQRALNDLSRDRTVIIIAHRLATVRDADRIVVMERGAVSEEGTHDSLIARGGLYAELCRLQFQ